MVIFKVVCSKSRVLGQIGRSGKVLGFISSNFGPNPTAGRPPKGNNRGAIIIIIIPDEHQLKRKVDRADHTNKNEQLDVHAMNGRFLGTSLGGD